MNLFINTLNTMFRNKRSYFFIVLIMFCLGISFGLYTVKYMGPSDKTDLLNYFTGFTNSIENQPINYGVLFFEVIKKNIILIIPIFIFGLTFFGYPIILLIDLIKGFTIGYTFSFIVTTFEGKGIGLAIAAIIPQNLIYIPCFIGLSVISLAMSMEKFKGYFFRNLKGKSIVEPYFIYRLILVLALFSVGMFVETYLTPNLFKFVAKRFYM